MASKDDIFGSPIMQAANKIAAGAQASAATGTFDEAKGVAGRVGEITSTGSPLMTAARTRAKQGMQRIGTLNSSLAGQAGEQAVIETATPIASADAQLYQTQQLENQRGQTQVSIANANLRGQIGMQGLQLGENSRQFDTGLAWDKDKTGANLMEQKRQFDSTLGLEGKKLDQQGEQFLANLQLEKDNLAAQREQFAQKLGLDVQQLDLSRAQLSQQDRQFLAELDQKGQQLAQQESQFTRDQANKVTLANIDAANREKLMQLEAGYKQDIASNDNISRAWGTMMESIDRIQTNGDLDPSTKQTLISNTQASFQSFANFWKKVGGGNVDVSDLLTFGPQNGSPVTPGGNSQGSTQMPDVYQPDYSATQWGG
jgi:hypothetical protein